MTVAMRNNPLHPEPAVAVQSGRMSVDAVEILRRHATATESYLRSAMSRQTAVPPALREAIEYSLFAGGKRLRPTLVLETASAVAGGQVLGDATRNALAAAGAIELIHTFSLVHDDLPAMDDDDLRRGLPTSHKKFGEAMAILAGDAMTTLAFDLLAADADARLAPALITELARAAGPAGMIGGQALDLASEELTLPIDDLRRVHAMKTGALITAACRMGAICAQAGGGDRAGVVAGDSAALRAVTGYSQHLGLAFQIVDDILDETSTPAQLGKATHKDAARGKNTYPALLGLEGARAEADRQVTAAVDAIGSLGAAADGLRALARFVTDRQA